MQDVFNVERRFASWDGDQVGISRRCAAERAVEKK